MGAARARGPMGCSTSAKVPPLSSPPIMNLMPSFLSHTVSPSPGESTTRAGEFSASAIDDLLSLKFGQHHVCQMAGTIHPRDHRVNIVWYSVYRNAGEEAQVRDEKAGRAPARDAAADCGGHRRVAPHEGPGAHHHKRDSRAGGCEQADRLQPLPRHNRPAEGVLEELDRAPPGTGPHPLEGDPRLARATAHGAGGALRLLRPHRADEGQRPARRGEHA